VFKLDQSQTAAPNASAMLVNRNTADATKKTMAKPGKKETNSTAIKPAPSGKVRSEQRKQLKKQATPQTGKSFDVA
jgi:hypothetical protein